jgi:taurine dioxygenase
MTIEARPLDHMGAEVRGIDLGRTPTEAEREQLNALWLEHGLLLFRNQSITPEQQIAFSRTFGELEAHPLAAIRLDGYPELIELRASDELRSPVAYYDDVPIIGRLGWHKDLIYTPAPNRGALLKAVTLPPHEGRTGFGDQGKAYDALDEETRRRIKGLNVVYRFGVHVPDMPFFDATGYRPGENAPRTPAEAGFQDFPEVVYPLVLTHPVNGRKILNVSQLFLNRVEGINRAEGDALLGRLVAHAMEDRFTHLHDWRDGDVILWDNWRCMHRTTGTRPGDARLIHRTTIRGDAVLGRVLEDA